MALVDRTHGRWPWLAAAAAGPATALALVHRDQLAHELRWTLWLPLPALLWHQTEEWVWPGGFLPWINREVLAAGEDEFPIDRAAGLVINTGLGWGVSALAIAAGVRRPAPGAAVLSMLVGNAALHVGLAARTRRRNPGTVTSVVLLAPLGAAGLRALARAEHAPTRQVALGAAAGLAASAGLMAAMRARLARRRR